MVEIGDFANNYCHDGNSLIVDFPQAPRKREEPLRHHAGSTTDDTASLATIEASSKLMMKRIKVRSVSFSDTSELTLVPYKSEQDLASAWYSKEDKNNQKRTILRNAVEVLRILKTGQALTPEDLCETVGMDNYMSPSLMLMSKIEKQRHAQSIIFAQTRLDPAVLSRFSRRSSLPSRQRAHERALSQF